jgi:hypothetical protein
LMTIIAARAGPEFRLWEAIALAAFLVAFSLAIFVYTLGLPFKLWP